MAGAMNISDNASSAAYGEIVGLLSLEIVAAQRLPKEKRFYALPVTLRILLLQLVSGKSLSDQKYAKHYKSCLEGEIGLFR